MKTRHIIYFLLAAFIFGVTLGHVLPANPPKKPTEVYVALCIDEYGEEYRVQYLAEAPDIRIENEICTIYRPVEL